MRPADASLTADSTPVEYAITRSPVVVATLTLITCGVGAGVFGVLPDVSWSYRWLLNADDVPVVIGPNAVRMRLLVGVLVILLPALAGGGWWRRLCSAATSAIVFAVLMGAFDMAGGRLPLGPDHGGDPATRMLQPLVAGTLSLAVTVVLHYRLPPAVRVDRYVTGAREWRSLVLFAVTGLLSLVTFAAVYTLSDEPSLFLRSVPVIVLGTGVLPFSITQTPVLYWLGRRSVRNLEPDRHPSLAVLIPALDEAGSIAQCLASIERAAGVYAGSCRVYVVDNGSRDSTAAVARRFIRRSRVIDGQVLVCHAPGKSHALNAGLRHIREDLVCRVDADTVIGADAIRLLVRRISTPDVGAAGGLPLPIQTNTWIGRMRFIEVRLNIAVRRVAHNAVQSVMCLPGNVVIYRRALLDHLGGFAEGINGEDTDITLRIARSGCRVVVDPDVQAWTGVPTNLAELREQRIRWARAGFHVASRNRGLIHPGQGPRGIWFFPLGILAMHARVILLPLSLGIVVAASSVTSGPVVTESLALIAAATCARLVLAAAVLVAMGQWRAVRWLFGYIPFRLLVLFYSLESFLTLPLRDGGPRTVSNVPLTPSEGFGRLPRTRATPGIPDPLPVGR